APFLRSRARKRASAFTWSSLVCWSPIELAADSTFQCPSNSRQRERLRRAPTPARLLRRAFEPPRAWQVLARSHAVSDAVEFLTQCEHHTVGGFNILGAQSL